MDKKARIATIVALVAILILAVAVVSAAKGGKGKPKPQCNDKIDNDGDGLIDLADPGCDNTRDNDEYNFVPEPDSCADTDGGNYPSLFGTTSGFLNNQAYSNDDFCTDGKNVNEFFCNGDYESSQEIYCGDDYITAPYCLGNVIWEDDVLVYCGAGKCDEMPMPIFVEICTNNCINGTCI